MADDLARLADLIRKHNALEREITEVISRPAALGHLGEYIASRIFGIALEQSASARAIDGHFGVGPLEGRSVNIKWYAQLEGLLDITPECLPDYYLALVGPRSSSMTSRARVRPWLIESVYLFDAKVLCKDLQSRGLAVGVACSVARSFWDSAEIYPGQANPALALSTVQREQLALFKEP